MRDVFQPIIDNVQIIDVQGKKKRMKMEMYMFSCELLLCVEKKTFIIFFVILPYLLQSPKSIPQNCLKWFGLVFFYVSVVCERLVQ